MKCENKFIQRILLPLFLGLFLLELFTLPFVVYYTFADRSQAPAGVVTYTTGKLEWNKKTDNGIAEIDIFRDNYKSVKSQTSSKVVAPGTENSTYARLINDSKGEIKYTAVLFEYKTDDKLAVYSDFYVKNSTPTSYYTLPDHIDPKNVVSVVEGKVTRNSFVDFDVNWVWEFEIDDKVDTQLGNKSYEDLDECTLGLYIVIEDDNGITTPQTGDRTGITLYMILLFVSMLSLLILLLERAIMKLKKRN